MINGEALDRLARNIEQHAFRRGYVSAFTLAAYPVETDAELTLHITRECDGLVYGNAEVGSLEAFKACVEALDGRVDYVVYDIDLDFQVIDADGKYVCAPDKSVMLPYRDLDVWIASVLHTLHALVPNLKQKKVVIVLGGNLHHQLGIKLFREMDGYCHSMGIAYENDLTSRMGTWEDPFPGAEIIIGAAVYHPVLTVDHIEKTGATPLLVDAGIGTLTPEASQYARENGLRMIRVDNRAAMAGTLFSIIQSHDLVTRVMGEGEINGVPVVAGGVVGAPGTVIVDSIDRPEQVIGLADGTGKVRYDPANGEERERLEKVKKALGGKEADG